MSYGLFILFQNQLVEYIHAIQSQISSEQYDMFRRYVMTYKESETAEKYKILLDFVNNLMEYNQAIVACDGSIFATDDLIYGSRDAICLIPGIDFRPLVRLNEQLMWQTIQRMYIIAMRILEPTEYAAQIQKNVLDLIHESFSSSETEFKSHDFLERVWNKFTDMLDANPELHEFKTSCTNLMTIQDIERFKPSIAHAVGSVVLITRELFKGKMAEINVFDLRDDFITLLDKVDKMMNENAIVTKGLLRMAQNIPFFQQLQSEFKQRCTDTKSAHELIQHIRTAVQNTELDSESIKSKVLYYLDRACEKLEPTAIERMIDSVMSYLPSIQALLASKS